MFWPPSGIQVNIGRNNISHATNFGYSEAMRQWLAAVRPGPTPGGTVILRMQADPDLPAFGSLGQMKDYAARRYAGVALCDVVCVWVRYRDWLVRQPRAASSD
jgi:hypothetical protein